MLFFSDLSDLIGVTKAQDIRYARILRHSLLALGAWPSKQLGEGDWYSLQIACLHLFVEMTMFPLGSLYIYNNFTTLSFFEQGQSYITVLMTVVCISRFSVIVTNTSKYFDIAGDFFNEIHLFIFKDESEFTMKTHLFIHKLSHFFTMYINTLLYFGLTMFTGIPLYNNYSSGMFKNPRPENGTFEQAVYYALPFNYKTEFKGYLCVFSFNCYISVICIYTFLSLDLFLSLIVFQVWGHLKILIHKIETFPRPSSGSQQTTEWYRREENDDVKFKLKEIIEYHLLITGFLAKMSDVFGPMILVYYGFHQASGCLLLLECSPMDTKSLLRYGPLTVGMFQQLIQLSVVFELVGSMTDKLTDAVYALPWECMETENRKTVFIMLQQSQRSLNLKAMDIIAVGTQTMTAIIKNSLSYFIMLRTVAKEE